MQPCGDPRGTKSEELSAREIVALINTMQLDPEDLTIPQLDSVFDYELDAVCKGEGDEELLYRCVRTLYRKTGDADLIDHKSSMGIDRALMTVRKKQQVRKRAGKKRMLITAAAIAMVTCFLTFAVSGIGSNIASYVREAAEMPGGSSISEGNITVTNHGVAKVYGSAQEMLAEEGLDILYPTLLPYGVVLEEINVLDKGTGQEHLLFSLNDDRVGLLILMGYDDPGSTFEGSEVYVHDGILFYLMELDGRYCAYAFRNGAQYVLDAENYDELILIINHLKEITK